ncbi:MAG TPA: membrane protein insertion efficiency factor YidD [Kiloniellales bacterium]|nr:membrane protein insertion efficiency factor YidD [Kiloniellales bacterium]
MNGTMRGATIRTLASAANAAMVFLLSLLVWGWRLLFAPLVGPGCRFQPTCSAYALDALRQHGALSGSLLTLRRLARCHPWGGAGYDPVPEAVRPGRKTCHHGHLPAASMHGRASTEPR